MSTTRLETVPQSWNDETDTAFFTVTARLFSAGFTYGAGVLLGSYDGDTDTSPCDTAAVTKATAPSSSSSAMDTDMVPVAVRRNR